MKVSPEARRLAKYKEKKKEISVVTLQFDVTFCTSILCAPSLKFFLSCLCNCALFVCSSHVEEIKNIMTNTLKSHFWRKNLIILSLHVVSNVVMDV